jgi:hypothetical protein
MSENLRVARLYLVVLALFTVGRWVMGVRGVPYERGHHVFSLVTLTVLASVFHAAFCRKWRGYSVLQAIGLGITLGLMSQVVILLATALSYALNVDTYFVNPRALNVEAALTAGEALPRRLGGLVANTLFNGIAGGIGWVLGATLPEPGRTT